MGAYEKGMEAANGGLSIADNPYDPVSEPADWAKWENGYCMATAEMIDQAEFDSDD